MLSTLPKQKSPASLSTINAATMRLCGGDLPASGERGAGWSPKQSALGAALRQEKSEYRISIFETLLDAWAVTGDILTLYQERIANESYLRTATERLSTLEQSRLLGYQLGPGLAAATHLAFTLEENPGLPKQAAQPVTLARDQGAKCSGEG